MDGGPLSVMSNESVLESLPNKREPDLGVCPIDSMKTSAFYLIKPDAKDFWKFPDQDGDPNDEKPHC